MYSYTVKRVYDQKTYSEYGPLNTSHRMKSHLITQNINNNNHPPYLQNQLNKNKKETFFTLRVIFLETTCLYIETNNKMEI
ncbi:hypothetical protein S4054249_08855 [Pseudoalteromonas luteoviolacea]|nr:hypothetical protein S4054249_08855 [Pseudoalteromonas luteoviolacea]AOT12862.1 hypothetical protein S40542_08855 [Pseudoalteromonas luteoviolacea]AOT17775.1 hypothetical protein S4054_08850 [Pseudoalteromonas luteoviolacea]